MGDSVVVFWSVEEGWFLNSQAIDHWLLPFLGYNWLFPRDYIYIIIYNYIYIIIYIGSINGVT